MNEPGACTTAAFERSDACEVIRVYRARVRVSVSECVRVRERTHTRNESERAGVRERVHVHACLRVRACACVRVHAGVRTGSTRSRESTTVSAWYSGLPVGTR